MPHRARLISKHDAANCHVRDPSAKARAVLRPIMYGACHHESAKATTLLTVFGVPLSPSVIWRSSARGCIALRAVAKSLRRSFLQILDYFGR
jgi:hypothetical protein